MRLAQRSTCLSFLSAGIKGLHCWIQLVLLIQGPWPWLKITLIAKNDFVCWVLLSPHFKSWGYKCGSPCLAVLFWGRVSLCAQGWLEFGVLPPPTECWDCSDVLLELLLITSFWATFGFFSRNICKTLCVVILNCQCRWSRSLSFLSEATRDWRGCECELSYSLVPESFLALFACLFLIWVCVFCQLSFFNDFLFCFTVMDCFLRT